jgi:hypothetical protein
MSVNQLRSKWAAVGAAVAVSLGAGGIGITHATTSSGEKPVYLPIKPCRLVDTRPAFQVGPRSAPVGPDETYVLNGQGSVGDCTLPTGTTALSLNVTAVGASAPTFLTLFPTGGPLPVASHLNPSPGQGPVPNAVNVDLNGSGKFSIYNLAGSVDIIIDVVGIFNDHNHDDRYYTEAEVDSMLPLWGAVYQSGGIADQGRGLVSVTRTGTGEYDVLFDRDVNECVAFATDSLFLANNDPSADTHAGDVNVVHVSATNSLNNPVDTYFSIMVLC